MGWHWGCNRRSLCPRTCPGSHGRRCRHVSLMALTLAISRRRSTPSPGALLDSRAAAGWFHPGKCWISRKGNRRTRRLDPLPIAGALRCGDAELSCCGGCRQRQPQDNTKKVGGGPRMQENLARQLTTSGLSPFGPVPFLLHMASSGPMIRSISAAIRHIRRPDCATFHCLRFNAFNFKSRTLRRPPGALYSFSTTPCRTHGHLDKPKPGQEYVRRFSLASYHGYPLSFGPTLEMIANACSN